MRKKIILCFFPFIFIAFHVYAGEQTYGNTECRYIRTYDGDTITVNIPGWPAVIGKEISVRIYGTDTAELRGTSGKEKESARNAKKMTENLCKRAAKLELRDIRRDKYFRLLAEVYADDKNVGDILIKNGLARPYFGDKRRNLTEKQSAYNKEGKK